MRFICEPDLNKFVQAAHMIWCPSREQSVVYLSLLTRGKPKVK